MTDPSEQGRQAAGQHSGRLRALVVDDEEPLVAFVRSYLEADGFDVEAALDGERGVELARSFEPDVIVLDLMLPGIDGIEACRRIRSFSDAYVVMLTARTEEVDRIIGLSIGADDYVTKPFSPRELVARIRAMLRRPRNPSTSSTVRRLGELTVDAAAREVMLAGVPVELTRIEFDLLDTLSGSARVAFTRRQLLEHVWGPNWFGDEHVVDVHIANLRAKLGDEASEPRYLRTVRGVGYRMGDG